MTEDTTNSVDGEAYWKHRSSTDWEESQGRARSRFFGWIASTGAPNWFVSYIQKNSLTVCDWGCAEGDGADVLARTWGVPITGVDFSQKAIDKARQYYPHLSFRTEDWLSAEPSPEQMFDIVFSSNTLEHFSDPWSVLASVARRARHLLALLLPYREFDRIDGHLFTFDATNIQARLDDGWQLLHSSVIDGARMPQTQWMGEQILLIYARQSITPLLELTLSDLSINQEEFDRLRFNWEGRLAASEAERKSALEAVLESSQREREQQQQEIARLRRRLDADRQAQLASIETARTELLAARNESERLAKLLETSKAYCAAAEVEIQLLRESAASQQNLPQKHEEAQRELSRLRDELEDRARELSTLRQSYEDASRERDQILARCQKISRSASWRATAPIREAAEGAKRLATWLTRALNETPAPASSNATLGAQGLVSIVLPVCDQACSLADAIEGVLAQTYGAWELLIVSDRSSDELGRAMAPYLDDPRIRVFHQPNLTPSSALNTGFAHVRGEFVTWTSADDIMLPGQIGALVAALRENPGFGLAYSDYEAIDERGKPLVSPAWRARDRPDGSNRLRLPRNVTIDNFHDSGDNFLGASFLWRRDIHVVTGRYDERALGGEDYDFRLRMHLATPFLHVPQSLHRHRVPDEALAARPSDPKGGDDIQGLLRADRERRRCLLERASLEQARTGPWRDTSQFNSAVLNGYDVIRYSELATKTPRPGRVIVLVLDAPMRLIETASLKSADIIVAQDDLTHFWLGRQDLPGHVRRFAGEVESVAPAIMHAVAQRVFERQTENGEETPPARPPARPRRRDIAKISFVIERWGQGGPEQAAVGLAAHLAKRGVGVSVAVANDAVPDALRGIGESAGFPVVGLAGRRDALAEYVRNEKIDVVNYHHSIFGADLLDSLGAAKVYTFHNSYVWFDEKQRSEWRRQMKSMDATVSVSRQAAAYARRWFDIDPARAFVIPNGISIDSLPANDADAESFQISSPGEPSYLNAETFSRLRLQNHLLLAFSQVLERLPNAKLTLAGAPADQDYYEEIKALPQRLGCEQSVNIVPERSRKTVMALMRSHSFLVTPSIVEGWSLSLMEAALNGMPILASDVGSARDLAGRSRGVVVMRPLGEPLEEMDSRSLWRRLTRPAPEYDADLAAAMIAMAEESDALKQEAESARSAIAQAFSIDRCVDGYLECFDEALWSKRAKLMS
jgi:glycosyltransferase involved in cell wall biosynthesis/SAM-dependent methyltransferase